MILVLYDTPLGVPHQASKLAVVTTKGRGKVREDVGAVGVSLAVGWIVLGNGECIASELN